MPRFHRIAERGSGSSGAADGNELSATGAHSEGGSELVVTSNSVIVISMSMAAMPEAKQTMRIVNTSSAKRLD